mmetsp:Transcript_11296/g.31521  ORF Transcript_11296/g.31521 Transcript_11296/m.31521 type:complete len:2613 (-) Transcript_11296:150-7988(-)
MESNGGCTNKRKREEFEELDHGGDSNEQTKRSRSFHISIESLAQKISNVISQIKDEAKLSSSNIAAFFGATGVGKTTTINFLCGAPIQLFKDDADDFDEGNFDVRVDVRSQFLEIGHHGSKTKSIDLLDVGDRQYSLVCCDMPGSSDDTQIDRIVNSVLRSRALQKAVATLPVLVLKLKGFDEGRFQNATSMFQFVSDSFEDMDSLKQYLVVLITHAEEDELKTIGKLSSHLKKLGGGQFQNLDTKTVDLISYLKDEASKAVNSLKDGEPNRSKVQVVNLASGELTREHLLKFLGNCEKIPRAHKKFSFNLENDAQQSVSQAFGDALRRITDIMSESFEYHRVAQLLIDMDEVENHMKVFMPRIPMSESSKKRVLDANSQLFDSIVLLVSTHITSTDSETKVIVVRLPELMEQFEKMQMICNEHTKRLLGGWKSLDCLRWELNKILKEFAELECGKGWGSIELCAQKIDSLLIVKGFEQLEVQAQIQTSISKNLGAQMAKVLKFDDPFEISDALSEMEQAVSILSGRRREIAEPPFNQAKDKVVSMCQTVLTAVVDIVDRMESDSHYNPADEQIRELQEGVFKLFRFTNAGQRIDKFLPEQFRSHSPNGFYKKFRDCLRLEEARELPRERLLHHFKLVSILSKVEDDDLKNRIAIHVQLFHSQITSFLENDFEGLRNSFLAQIYDGKSEISMYFGETAGHTEKVQEFIAFLKNSLHLLQIDELDFDRPCTKRLADFFQGTVFKHFQRLIMRFKAELGPQTFPDLLSASILHRHWEYSDLITVFDPKVHQRADTQLQKFSQIFTEFDNARFESVEQCISLLRQKVGSEDFNFSALPALRYLDQSLENLEYLRVIMGNGHHSCIGASDWIKQQYQKFVQKNMDAFSVEVVKEPLEVQIDIILEVAKNLFPAAPPLTKNLDSVESHREAVMSTIGEYENFLIEWTCKSSPNHSAVVRVSDGLAKLIRWRKMESLRLANNQSGSPENDKIRLLSEAREKVESRLNKVVVEAKTAVDDSEFDKAAKLLRHFENSPEEKDTVMSHIESKLNFHKRNIEKILTQILWLEGTQIKELGESFEFASSCLTSTLADVIEQALRDSIEQCTQSVRKHYFQLVEKLKSDLDLRTRKVATYKSADQSIRMILEARVFLPQLFGPVVEQIQIHLDAVNKLLEGDEENLEMLLSSANTVGEICSDLFLLASNPTSSFNVSAVSKRLEPFFADIGGRMVRVFVSLKRRANEMMCGEEINLDEAGKLISAMEGIAENLRRVECNPAWLATTMNFEPEKSKLGDLQRQGRSRMKTLLRNGTFDEAVAMVSRLPSVDFPAALQIIKEHGESLMTTLGTAVQQGNFIGQAKAACSLRALKDAVRSDSKFEEYACDWDLRLKELDDNIEDRLYRIQERLTSLLQKDRYASTLGSWTEQLKQFQSCSQQGSGLFKSRIDDIAGLIHKYAAKLKSELYELLLQIETDAQNIEWSTLNKMLLALDSNLETMQEIEKILLQSSMALEFSPATLNEDGNAKLRHFLGGKQTEVIDELEKGIMDRTKVSRIFSTLGTLAQKFQTEFDELVVRIRSQISNISAKAQTLIGDRKNGWNDEFNSIIATMKAGEYAFQHNSTLQKAFHDALGAVESPIRNDIVALKKSILSKCCRQECNVGEIAVQILEMREIASLIDSLHDFAKKEIRETLLKLDNSENLDQMFMVKLGQAFLTSDKPSGKSIIQENPVFERLNNIMYNQHMKSKATVDAKQALQNILHLNPHMTKASVEESYQKYQEVFSALIQKSIKNVTKPIEVRKQELISGLNSVLRRQDSQHTLLAYICAIFSFCKSAQHYGSGSDEDCIIQPHEIQIFSIMEMIGLNSGCGRSNWNILPALRKTNPKKFGASKGTENHFMQIPTGEGKSIVLGITAAFFAVQKMPVDCVCYSRYLSGRDKGDFEKVFEFLKDAHQDMAEIRYLTFEELCEAHIEGIREAVDDVIAGKPVGVMHDPAGTGRVLLIDEADVFFTKRFYGNKHSPGTLLRSKEISSMISAIWDQRHALKDQPDSVLQLPAYQDSVTRFSTVGQIINQAAKQLVKNSTDVNNPKYAWTFNKEGKLGYNDGGQFRDASKFRHQNRTVFAFLSERDQTNPYITEDVLDAMLGIEIKCGDFSYATLPMKYYRHIFGVTGTLETLTDRETGILEAEYKITKRTLIPSAFGKPRLDFDFSNQLHVLVAPNVSEWHAKIDAEVRGAIDVGRAVIVVLKNDSILKDFVTANALYSSAKRLDSNVDDQDVQYVNGIVANATLPGKVTLITRKFGRGLDFKASKKVNDAGGVLVIQTFFSSSESEEIQIRGRTARQGEKGSYRLLLCLDHLKDKFDLDYHEGMAQEVLKSKLTAARLAKSQAKFDSRAKLKSSAERLDHKSWEFQKLLYSSASSDEKLLRLSELTMACSTSAVTFVLLLDVSGSMKCHWSALKNAFDAFVQAVRDGGHEEAGSLVTVVLFDHTAETLFSDKPLSEVPRLPKNMPKGGATSFRAAFTSCLSEISYSSQQFPGRRFVVVFMTDGEDMDPVLTAEELENLFVDVAGSLSGYYSIAFGGAPALTQLEQVFLDLGVKVKAVQPREARALVEAFQSVATDSVLHM